MPVVLELRSVCCVICVLLPGVSAVNVLALSQNLTEAGGGINALAFSHDGRWLATGSADHRARLYRYRGEAVHKLLAFNLSDAAGSIHAVAFSGDSKWLATGGDHRARLYRMDGSEEEEHGPILQHELTDAKGSVINALAFTLDSHVLATGSGDSLVRIYDMQDRAKPSLAHTLKDAGGPLLAVAISSDGHWLATGSSDHMLRLYSFQGGGFAPKLVHILAEAHAMILTVAFSGDARWLASGSGDGRVRIYSILVGFAPTLAYTLQDAAGWVWSVAFSGDSHWLATGSGDGSARLYAMPRKGGYSSAVPFMAEALADAGDSVVNAVVFSGDGRELATGSSDHRVRLYAMPGTGVGSDSSSMPKVTHVSGSAPTGMSAVLLLSASIVSCALLKRFWPAFGRQPSRSQERTTEMTTPGFQL